MHYICFNKAIYGMMTNISDVKVIFKQSHKTSCVLRIISEFTMQKSIACSLHTVHISPAPITQSLSIPFCTSHTSLGTDFLRETHKLSSIYTRVVSFSYNSYKNKISVLVPVGFTFRDILNTRKILENV